MSRLDLDLLVVATFLAATAIVFFLRSNAAFEQRRKLGRVVTSAVPLATMFSIAVLIFDANRLLEF